MNKNIKKIELEKVSAQLDSFGKEIKTNSDYKKYKELIKEEIKLSKEHFFEEMKEKIKNKENIDSSLFDVSFFKKREIRISINNQETKEVKSLDKIGFISSTKNF
jgi:seryl-tRNA synthetase